VSQENVDTLQRWRESWSRQDAGATIACLHEAVIIDFSAARGPFQGVYRGPDEVLGMLRSICGPDRVITVNLFQAEGRNSGIATGATVANLWSFRDGLIHRAELFQTREEALEAAGHV
jgi:hypothetical protein